MDKINIPAPAMEWDTSIYQCVFWLNRMISIQESSGGQPVSDRCRSSCVWPKSQSWKTCRIKKNDVRIYFGIRCLKNGVFRLRRAESEERRGNRVLFDAQWACDERVSYLCVRVNWWLASFLACPIDQWWVCKADWSSDTPFSVHSTSNSDLFPLPPANTRVSLDLPPKVRELYPLELRELLCVSSPLLAQFLLHPLQL